MRVGERVDIPATCIVCTEGSLSLANQGICRCTRLLTVKASTKPSGVTLTRRFMDVAVKRRTAGIPQMAEAIAAAKTCCSNSDRVKTGSLISAAIDLRLLLPPPIPNSRALLRGNARSEHFLTSRPA
jgi:hypothetical protein